MGKKKNKPAAKGGAGPQRPASAPSYNPPIPAAYMALREQFSEALKAGQASAMHELLAQMRATPKLSLDMKAMQLEAEISLLLSRASKTDDEAAVEDAIRDRLEDLAKLIDRQDLSGEMYGSMLLMRALCSHRLCEYEDYLADMEEFESLYQVPLLLRSELCRVRANSFMEMDEPEEALAEYESLLAEPELSAEQRLEATLDSVPILLELDRQREARKRLEMIMADSALGNGYRGACLMYLPKTYTSPKDQLARWHEAINSGLLDAEALGSALCERHELLLDAGDSAGALADLQAALAIPGLADNDRFGCQMSLSGIYISQNRHDEALAILDPIVAATQGGLPKPGAFPEEEEFGALAQHFGARVPRAMTYALLGRLDEARQDLQALELYADMFPYAQEMLDEVKAAIKQMARDNQKAQKKKRK